jgi:hypothetical protein
MKLKFKDAIVITLCLLITYLAAVMWWWEATS